MSEARATPRLVTQPLDQTDKATIAAWSGLVAELQLNPTLDPGWLEVSARAVAAPGTRLSLTTALASDGTLLAAVPTFSRAARMLGVPMLALELGSNLMSYHAELVSKAQYADVIGALLDSQSAWDVFHVANVDAESRTAKALLEVAAKLDAPLQVIPSDRSPYLPIAETWEQFIAGKGKKFRYKLRRRSDDIERDGGCELRWFGPNDDMERLLHDVLAIETRSWKAGARLAIGSRELELTYHRLLLPYLQHGRMLVANVLYRQGQPIAYSLCCECRGWMGHLKTSFDQDYERLSPGGFVIDACVRRAFESGAREFDFLGAAAPHKLAWTSFVRAHNNYYLFAPRLVPKLIGRAKLYWSRRRRHPPTDTPSVNPLSD